ncbi:secreted RxLR effector peptide protein, putative [Phytophthora infestans T30-4]|uniref:Secreted RxLR effector peptide protein, putative n=2 Tax=Phytophthora infestans TaxID=4787 RepID=D0MX72_PHYIT|nr:secreted RxLR effector peptide protein, putative [Phytophthora infestans T30-4]EEY64235.1 secreted RxLR effector peptide protein, putative [Phytophthora infestans T30-4]KAF4129653.1 hypothetical protein GN958_ATG21148 [Phytophthora infestans]|eukprot:XP_002907671.1 secreted RxLR effector peptide protein, putative [Phytophthora infestans T30-4]
MRLATILLAASLCVSGDALPVQANTFDGAQEAAAMGRKLLRSGERFSEVTEERTPLSTLLKLDDVAENEVAMIKQLAPTFAKYNQNNKQATDVYNILLRRGISFRSAEKARGLYEKYLLKPNAFHA